MKILLCNMMLSHGAFHHWMTYDLKALGHDVMTIDPDELCEQFSIEIWRKALFDRVANDRPEMLLVYPPYDLLRKKEHDALNDMGVAVVAYAYDDPIYLPSYMHTEKDWKRILGEFHDTYDVYLTTSRQMVREASNVGADWMKLIRWAINTPENPFAVKRDLDVVVIGAPYPRRVRMVEHLMRAGIKPTIFGEPRWQQFSSVKECYHGMLSRPGMFETYRKAKIALAPSDYESTHTPMIKLRTLEISGCGAFQLVEEAEDLRDYFDDGKDIGSYKTWDELAEKIKYYLSHETERDAIARAGWDRTVKDHVWKARWSEVETLVKPVVDRLAPKRQAKASPVKNLPRLMYTAACALHFERINDLMSASVVFDDWLEQEPDGFSPLLGKGRSLFYQREFAGAEKFFTQAAEAAKDYCNHCINVTPSQRKVGQRFGLGRLFSGIFPRVIEPWAFLLMIYAIQDRTADVEKLMVEMSKDTDELFVVLAAVISQPTPEQVVGHKYLGRFVEVLLTLEPWAGGWKGEKQRHRAFFYMVLGICRASLGDRAAGRQCMEYALTQEPYPEVADQLRKHLASL